MYTYGTSSCTPQLNECYYHALWLECSAKQAVCPAHHLTKWSLQWQWMPHFHWERWLILPHPSLPPLLTLLSILPLLFSLPSNIFSSPPTRSVGIFPWLWKKCRGQYQGIQPSLEWIQVLQEVYHGKSIQVCTTPSNRPIYPVVFPS